MRWRWGVTVGRAAVAMLAAVAALALAACGDGTGIEAKVTDSATRVGLGETLRVDLGAANPSVGDSWYLVGRPDPAVLMDRGDHFDPDCDEPGCGGRLSWSFAATGAGTTTLVFRYCYRSAPDDCQPQPGRAPTVPVSLTVTVS